MIDWADFFDRVDRMTDDAEREKWLALLHRNFALGHPSGWAGIADASPELQQRLGTEWLGWALRDVEWLARATA